MKINENFGRKRCEMRKNSDENKNKKNQNIPHLGRNRNCFTLGRNDSSSKFLVFFIFFPFFCQF